MIEELAVQGSGRSPTAHPEPPDDGSGPARPPRRSSGGRPSPDFTTAQPDSCVIVSAMADLAALPHPLDDRLLELIAQQFRVLAEPMRLKLLDALRDGDATVQELQQVTGA